MFIADSHTHSICSPDGVVPMTEMAKGAVRAGISSLCITDHCDFLSLDGMERITNYDWMPLLAQYQEMRSQWGSHIDLPLGLEFGMGFLDPQAAETVLALPELDFVIGSVHNLSEEAGGKDFYCVSYETEADCYLALDNYFSSMERLAEGKFYDVLGHIIYPLRYMNGNYQYPISLWKYTDQIRVILKKAVESGRGMEVNTWKGKTLNEWIPVLQLYKECGGEIITVGSDAHDPEPIGRGVKHAYAMLSDLGFRYVANYHERKPQFWKL
ncbi:MAG: Histidinol-phosphatase [Evtepia sp.]|jgi:histidinol-phosphatase (PHP family)|nr:Histidinol-phosphatase [Evtepia sp.]